jgi:hypothetical protein
MLVIPSESSPPDRLLLHPRLTVVRSCWDWARTHLQNGSERTSMGLATAILTTRNSLVISIAQKAAKCQNGL